MMRRVVLCFALVGLAVASAKSYSIVVAEQAEAGSAELQPGNYKVEWSGDKAVLKNGKFNAESSVKVETNTRKYDSTSVKYSNADGKMRILEIHLGGTNTRLVFPAPAAVAQ